MAIAVPRYSTLSDAIQRVHTGEVKFPSDPDLWAALLAAIPLTPGSQEPPLFALEDSATKDAFNVNQQFLRDFIERWEDERSHVVTVRSSIGLRTFRAGQRFWDFVVLSHAQAKFKGDYEGESSEIVATSNLAAHNELRMSLVAWTQLVERWNDRNTPRAGIDPLPMVSVEEPREDGVNQRQRAHAIADPSTIVEDDDLRAMEARARRRERGSRYWTHFMNHWELLVAQHRNYLVNAAPAVASAVPPPPVHRPARAVSP